MTQLELEKKAEIWVNTERWPNIEDAAEVNMKLYRPVVLKLTLIPAQRGCRSRTEG
jgi:hypothetical protein